MRSNCDGWSQTEWICLCVVRHRHDAERIKLALLKNNIPCWIRSGDAAGHLPSLAFVQGLGLMVPRAFQKQAKEILKVCDNSPFSIKDPSDED